MLNFNNTILITSMPRSGSNAIWNIVGSSPAVQMTKHEFHQFYQSITWKSARKFCRISEALSTVLLNNAFSSRLFNKCLENDVRAALLDDTQLFELRSVDPTATSHVCFKMMERDVAIAECVAREFTYAQVLAITREPYALCESLMRRGISVKHAANACTRYFQHLERVKNRFGDRCHVVHFESLLKDPVALAEQIFEKLGLARPVGNQILYKPKGFGPGLENSSKRRHKKILLDYDALNTTFISDVNKRSVQRLSNIEKKTIRQIVGSSSLPFGYA